MTQMKAMSLFNRSMIRRSLQPSPVPSAVAGSLPASTMAHPADSYQPSEGVGLARKVGKAKRLVAKFGLIGMAAGALVAAVSSPPLLAGALLLSAGGAGYGFSLLNSAEKVFSQQKIADQTFHSTLQTQTTLDQRRTAFRKLEKSLEAPANLGTSDALRGTRKATVQRTNRGVAFLWKGTEPANKLRRKVPEGTENKREMAAYLVDKQLGHFAQVPPTVAKNVDGEDGIATLIVGEAKSLDDATNWLLKKSDKEGYRRLAIFDQIIGNLDRHPRNFLTTEEGPTVPIDHGLAFPTSNGFQGMEVNYVFDRAVELKDNEKKMLGDFLGRKQEVVSELSPLLEPEAISAMFERVEKMLDGGEASRDWAWTLL